MSIHTITQEDTMLCVDTDGAWVTALRDEKSDILYPRQILENETGERKQRGGCHVCLPQFGPARDELQLAQHGFGRDSAWTLQEKTTDRLVFHLAPTHDAYVGLQAVLTYTLDSRSLTVELSLHNDSSREMRVAPAFHPYFATGDAVTIGIDDETVDVAAYHDMKPDTGAKKQIETQGRMVTVASEELNTWALWSDRLGEYFCVEPTLGGYRFLNEVPDEDEVLLPNGHAAYVMTISW